jgi:transposase
VNLRDFPFGQFLIQDVRRIRRPAGMSLALSLDLRRRVVAAVDEDGLTHRQAAERFRVSAASVSRWRRLAREKGEPRPGPLGGDRRTHVIEAQAATILEVFEARRDMSLEELRTELTGRGLSFGYGTLWRFFHRRGWTRKKRPPTPPNRSVPTS